VKVPRWFKVFAFLLALVLNGLVTSRLFSGRLAFVPGWITFLVVAIIVLSCALALLGLYRAFRKRNLDGFSQLVFWAPAFLAHIPASSVNGPISIDIFFAGAVTVYVIVMFVLDEMIQRERRRESAVRP
jgi:hypothetical protein